MKMLFSAPVVQGKLWLLKCELEDAGIQCEVRNESSVYSLTIDYPELWVLNDEDFDKACAIRKDIFSVPEPKDTTDTSKSEETLAPAVTLLTSWSPKIKKLFFAAAAVFTFLFGINALEVHQQLSWPTTEGLTIDARDESRTSIESRAVGNQIQVSHRLVLTYEYKVDGRRYETSRTYFINDSQAENMPGGFGAGSQITVHYNPNNPAEAALGYVHVRYELLIIALFLLLPAIAITKDEKKPLQRTSSQPAQPPITPE